MDGGIPLSFFTYLYIPKSYQTPIGAPTHDPILSLLFSSLLILILILIQLNQTLILLLIEF